MWPSVAAWNQFYRFTKSFKTTEPHKFLHPFKPFPLSVVKSYLVSDSSQGTLPTYFSLKTFSCLDFLSDSNSRWLWNENVRKEVRLSSCQGRVSCDFQTGGKIWLSDVIVDETVKIWLLRFPQTYEKRVILPMSLLWIEWLQIQFCSQSRWIESKHWSIWLSSHKLKLSWMREHITSQPIFVRYQKVYSVKNGKGWFQWAKCNHSLWSIMWFALGCAEVKFSSFKFNKRNRQIENKPGSSDTNNMKHRVWKLIFIVTTFNHVMSPPPINVVMILILLAFKTKRLKQILIY